MTRAAATATDTIPATAMSGRALRTGMELLSARGGRTGVHGRRRQALALRTVLPSDRHGSWSISGKLPPPSRGDRDKIVHRHEPLGHRHEPPRRTVSSGRRWDTNDAERPHTAGGSARGTARRSEGARENGQYMYVSMKRAGFRGALVAMAAAAVVGAAVVDATTAPVTHAVGHDPLVQSWGANVTGQLGNATMIDRYAPTPIPALPKQDVQQLAAGADATSGSGFAVALLNDNTVWTWGQNDKGQLGTGLVTKAIPVPGRVPGLNGITQVAAGSLHALALRNNGDPQDGVWAWGDNIHGQLGDSTNVPKTVPVPVQGLTGSGTIAVATGCEHSLALREGGTLMAWGNNDKGQLGNDTILLSTIPVEVKNLTSPVVEIAAGCNFSLARLADGTIKAWGENGHGELGNGQTANSLTPVSVTGLPPGSAERIVAGGNHSYALYSDYRVYGWGSNDKGQLADGTINPRTQAMQASKLPKVTSIAAGKDYGIALTDGNQNIIGWGNNARGQLGSGTTDPHTLVGQDTPVLIFQQEDEADNPYTRIAVPTAGESSYAY
ncbi:sialidase [Streptomyces clavuligerus]|nr:sialidase [Streptomyces clavuligerus]QCS04493.1 sialidase [Streptomyces clavuligerus]QPJ96126.1 sialidase [Streptomyces clavuligerus]